MRKDLAKRLARVAYTIKFLKKIATEEAKSIEEFSKRSMESLKQARAKVEGAVSEVLKNDPELAQEVVSYIKSIVTDPGVVNQELIQQNQQFSGLGKLSKEAPALAGILARFVVAALMGSRLQNSDRVEQAKRDPRYLKSFYKSQENMANSLAKMNSLIQSAVSAAPLPLVRRKPKEDLNALRIVKNMIDDAEREMQAVVEELSRALASTARDLFPEDNQLNASLEEHIFLMISPTGEINTELNKDKDFYRGMLHMEEASATYDLGEFLDTKNKKLVYLSYRSLVMAGRALGVMQFAQDRPDIVLKSKKAQELVVKAQEILKKRQKLIVSKLKALRAEEDESDEDRGVPGGTFDDYFSAVA